MAFPNDPLDVVVEINLNGSWVDITTDVLVRDGINISRGLRDEASRADASKCSLSIKNNDGKYSPRNPRSPYFGLLTRNTPIRVSAEGSVRFIGEISAWPSRWDVSGNDVWVPIDASGITRRLGQGAEALRSALYRGLTNSSISSSVVAYWPCEDANGSSRISSGIGGPAMTFTGTPDLASYSAYDASEPIPLLNGSVWTGAVPYYPPTGDTSIRFLLSVPDAGLPTEHVFVRTFCSGTASQWLVRFYNPDGLVVQSFDADGVFLLDYIVTFAIKGKDLRVSLDLHQNGANVDYTISTLRPGQTVGEFLTGTLPSVTIGSVTRVVVNDSEQITDTGLGHISVQNSITSIFDLKYQLMAYTGETAGRRVERLCDEEGISFTSVGDLDDSVAMGPQKPNTLLDLLGEAAESDMGLLYEPRDDLGLVYRTRSSLYNQSPAVELDYDAGHLAPPLDPVDDDQATRNDITVSREGGSSARAVLTSGPLSTAAPPNGVGRYNNSVTVSVKADEDLPDQAQWRIHVGTVDEARYPQVSVDLSNHNVSSDTSLSSDLILIDSGDRLTIDNQPLWLPPNLISQIVLGFSEKLSSYEWFITMNCVPESPYQVAVYGTGRYGTEYSTLSSSATSSATSLSVATSTGPLWTTAAGDFPMDIIVAGERMTVTAISGSSSPQTFTVTRSVNGVTKAQSSGAVVNFFTPSVRAL